MLSGILARLGLVRVVRYRKAVEDLKKTQSRVEKLSAECETLRTEIRGRRAKSEEATKALRLSEEHARTLVERTDRLRSDLERKKAEIKEKFESDQRRRAEQDEKRLADVEVLQQRLANAEKELTITRESLMAVEVKLDILEGAANVLDARTRAVLADTERKAEAGAPI